jgi:hypothetical protein
MLRQRAGHRHGQNVDQDDYHGTLGWEMRPNVERVAGGDAPGQ